MLDGNNNHSVCADVDLEQALVALLFADNENFQRIGDLRPSDLTDATLAAIFDAGLDLRSKGRPVNLITLKTRLEAMRDDERSGMDVVRGLSLAGTLPSVDEIAKRLKSLSQRRLVADYLRGLATDFEGDIANYGALASDGIKTLNDYISEINSQRKEDPELYEASQEFFERLQAGDDPIEIPTGLTDLDEATGGWHRGQFAILAGRPSMGKSTVMLSSVLRTAMKGHGVLLFSLEMTMDQLVARAVTDVGYTTPVLAYSDLKPGKVTPPQIRRLYDASERFKDMPIVIDTRAGLTVGDMIAKVRRTVEDLKAKNTELALVVVDHLLKIKPSSRYAGNSVKELDEISEAMCVIAKTYNVAVVGLHQLNRQVESRDNPRPVLSDLRGSGSLEQDADVVLFVYRPAYQFERQAQEGNDEQKAAAADAAEALKNSLEIQIAKQRNGPCKTLHMWVDMAANAVRDRDWRR